MRKSLLVSLFCILVSSFCFGSELFVVSLYGQAAYRILGDDNVLRIYSPTGEYLPDSDFSIPGKYKKLFVTFAQYFVLGEDNVVRVYAYTGEYNPKNDFSIPSKFKDIYPIPGGLSIRGEDNIVRRYMVGRGHIPELDFPLPPTCK